MDCEDPAMKARDLLRAVEMYESLAAIDPETLLAGMGDEEIRTMVRVVAELFLDVKGRGNPSRSLGRSQDAKTPSRGK